VSVISVPYHLDEYLPDLDLPLAPDEVITAELPDGDVWARLASLYSEVARAVADAAGAAGAADADRGGPPVVLSGDCTTALGTVAGLQRAGADAGIVWFDAHGDVQTLETTASGYLGGLPLRMLTGYRPELVATRLGLRPVAERRVLLAGARDLDPPEAEYLADAGIGRTGVAALDLGQPPDAPPPEAGAPEAGAPDAALPDAGALDALPTDTRPTDVHAAEGQLPGGPLYVHVDLDVIDPGHVPGLRYPAPGGPGPDEVARVLGLLLATGRVAAVGLACTWHPGHGAAARLSRHLETALAGRPT
jgi:arginase